MGDFNTGAAPVGVLARALTGNVFVEQSLAYMNEGDKDSYNAYKHDIKNVLRAMSDNPAQTVANTSKKKAYNRPLVVVETFETFDPKDYHHMWKEFQPDGNFQWEGLPTQVQSSLEELFLGSAAEAVEEVLTNGSTALGITGLIPQLRLSALTSLKGGSATPQQVVDRSAIAERFSAGKGGEALTSANLLGKLDTIIAAQTNEMRKRPGRKLMISPRTSDLLFAAQRNLEYKGVDITEEGVLRYAGYDFVVNDSFPANDILLASMTGDFKTDAIQMGTSQSSDYNNLEVDRVSTFGRHWGMLLTFALDIFLVRPEECVYYTDQTIA